MGHSLIVGFLKYVGLKLLGNPHTSPIMPHTSPIMQVSGAVVAMMKLILLVVVIAQLCSYVIAGFVMIDSVSSIHAKRKDWIVYSPIAEPDAFHSVVVSVKQRNLDSVERQLHEVSTPGNAKYGQHLTRQQVYELTGDIVAAGRVRAHIESSASAGDIKSISQTSYGEFITVDAKVSFLSTLFNTKFHILYNSKTGRKVIRTNEIHLPSEVAGDVFTVFGTVQVPLPDKATSMIKKKNSFMNVDGVTLDATVVPAGSTTPDIIKSSYNVQAGDVAGSSTTQAVYESLNQTFAQNDLAWMQGNFSIPLTPVATVIGGHESDGWCMTSPNDCGEANLDVQYMIGIAQASTTYWYSDDDFDAWIVQVATASTVPQVFSISYGADEAFMQGSSVSAFNTEAMKLGLQGVTIVASSGDDGATSSNTRNDPSSCGYAPNWPAASPYVTAVGATQGLETSTTEIACDSATGGLITSGGGFSYWFPLPAWQTTSVQNYFANVANTPQEGYSTYGRGIPDVAMAGHNYLVWIGGQPVQVSGTSASSPVFASFVTLVNAKRLAASKSTMGWLNPFLYATANATDTWANDITSGNNYCSAGAPGGAVCCSQGFECSIGWDPLTGLGSVDFTKFATAAMNVA